MKEQRTETGTESRPVWKSREALARQGVQRLLQRLLKEEVEEVLVRRRYERRDGVDATPGYRNGFGKPRRLSAMAGTITVCRPRLPGLEARFERPRMWWSRRSRRCGCGPRRRSGSRRWRTRRRSSGRRYSSRSSAFAGWTRPSASPRSPRASCRSTACGGSGATRRPPPDLVYTLLDKTSC